MPELLIQTIWAFIFSDVKWLLVSLTSFKGLRNLRVVAYRRPGSPKVAFAEVLAPNLPQLPSNKDYKALNGATLGGAGKGLYYCHGEVSGSGCSLRVHGLGLKVRRLCQGLEALGAAKTT